MNYIFAPLASVPSTWIDAVARDYLDFNVREGIFIEGQFDRAAWMRSVHYTLAHRAVGDALGENGWALKGSGMWWTIHKDETPSYDATVIGVGETVGLILLLLFVVWLVVR